MKKPAWKRAKERERERDKKKKKSQPQCPHPNLNLNPVSLPLSARLRAQVLRDQPEDIAVYGAKYFRKRLEDGEAPAERVRALPLVGFL